MRATNKVNLDQFSPEALNEAKRVLRGESSLFGFDGNGKLSLLDREIATQDAASDWKGAEEGELPENNNFSNHEAEVVLATIALVADRLSNSRYAASIGKKMHVSVKVRHMHSALFFGEDGYSGDVYGRNTLGQEEGALERNMEGLNESLARLEELAKSPVIDDSSTWRFTREGVDEMTHNDPRLLAKDALSHAKAIKRDFPEDYMRLHNQFPQTVNFIKLSQEMAPLLSSHGKEVEVKDALSFLNSYWMPLAGQVQCQVEPEALSFVRHSLERTHESLRT